MNDTSSSDMTATRNIVRKMIADPRDWKGSATWMLTHDYKTSPTISTIMRSSPPLRTLLEAVAAGCDIVPPEIAEAAVAAAGGREMASPSVPVLGRLREAEASLETVWEQWRIADRAVRTIGARLGVLEGNLAALRQTLEAGQ